MEKYTSIFKNIKTSGFNVYGESHLPGNTLDRSITVVCFTHSLNIVPWKVVILQICPLLPILIWSSSPDARHSSLSFNFASQCPGPGNTHKAEKSISLRIFTKGRRRRQFPARALNSFATWRKHSSCHGQLPVAWTRLFARGGFWKSLKILFFRFTQLHGWW